MAIMALWPMLQEKLSSNGSRIVNMGVKMSTKKTKTTTFQHVPYLREKLEAIVEKGDFNSMSSLINTALAEWLKDREIKAEKKRKD